MRKITLLRNQILLFAIVLTTSFSRGQVSASALSFDGVNDYVELGDIMPATYTKEAWFYLSDLSLQNNLISGGSDGQHALYPSANYGNRLSAGHNGIWNAVQDPTPIAANTWYHVALTYDAATTTMKMYKNGVLVASNTSVPPFTGGNAVRLGTFDTANLLGGKLDEVRIWNRVLPECEIQNNMNGELPAGQVGLVAYYKCNQGIHAANNTAITTLIDTSGNDNTGTLSGFALTGSSSNWVTPGGVVTGTMSPAQLSVTSPQFFCTAATIADLTATGMGIKWYSSLESLNELGATTALTSGTTYYVSQTIGSCESPRNAVVVMINTTSAPTAISPQTFNKDATVANIAATGTDLKWYAASTGSTTLANSSPITGGIYYVSQTVSGCESLRTAIEVNLNASALDFDGIDDKVNCDTGISTVLSNTNKLTVEAWIKTTRDSNVETIVSNHGNGSSTQFDLRTVNGEFNCFIGFGSYVVTGGTVIPNTWQHVAMVFDGTSVTLYVDGVNVGTTPTPSNYTLPTSVAPMILGYNGYGEIFKGQMDEVRVWNKALTQTEIQNNKNCELGPGQTNLLAYYQFNQGLDNRNNSTVTTVADASSNAYTGMLDGFELIGNTSNWTATSIVTTGNTCSTNLNNNHFEFSSKTTVYPNPSNGLFSLNNDARAAIVVYDLNGKIIKSENINFGNTNLNLNSSPNGVYLLKITYDNNQVETIKLIKK
ncbi:LamG-like jellyroll fold domain-containing protein [Flavobacterium salmonis]|uniref:LamG-like jellyroll fold domain-containing protein n=1 Tax=Flavobacterium salmonis TaxID=2654844 RepID=A0A6V6YTI4_9FLAO|nr:LamG-like jellyroll fold domain-containing protein [Flavobacterium salmonis]CAD0002584.1 hypothetical protein FLAT13_01246 [Flavobacterium salmonis]